MSESYLETLDKKEIIDFYIRQIDYSRELEQKIDKAIKVVYACTFLDIHRRELLEILEGKNENSDER